MPCHRCLETDRLVQAKPPTLLSYSRPDRTGQTTGLVRTATWAWTASATTRRATGVPRTRAHTVAGAAGTGAGTAGGSARPRPPCSGAWACVACWPETRHRPPRTCRCGRRHTIPTAMWTVITSFAGEMRCVYAAADAAATTSASVFRLENSRHTPSIDKVQFTSVCVCI